MGQRPKFVELFCGIGGFAEAVSESASESVDVISACDINRNALDVYRLNHAHPVVCKTIESLSPADVSEWASKYWWMSPPCQPHTQRGRQLDLNDSRSQAFLHVLTMIEQLRPCGIALENVPQFAGSESHRRLTQMLDQCGYHFRELELCPTQFGAINRRRRFYLIASLGEISDWSSVETRIGTGLSLEFELNEPFPDELLVAPEVEQRYAKALDVLDLSNPESKTSCFTSAYGRSHIRSGSVIKTEFGLRRFSPHEILWQLGFSPETKLPKIESRRLWPLVGNSLSIPCVQFIVSHLLSQTSDV